MAVCVNTLSALSAVSSTTVGTIDCHYCCKAYITSFLKIHLNHWTASVEAILALLAPDSADRNVCSVAVMIIKESLKRFIIKVHIFSWDAEFQAKASCEICSAMNFSVSVDLVEFDK